MRTYKAFHIACGIGGGALGYKRARSVHAGAEARFRNVGAVDVDPVALEDYRRLVGEPATQLDLFDRRAYEAFHGQPPPASWREATVDDIRRAAGGEHPDVVFTSLPCKGFSGLLANGLAKTAKYQALNSLVHRATFLMLEAFAARPPRLLVYENVPRIQTRGRALIDSVTRMLHSYGYVTAETTHCCGEIGGLGQRRTRWLMVARHVGTTRPFLFEPPKRRLRTIGEVIGGLPMPHDARGGAMHTLPGIKNKAWWQLALIPPGGDWRDLRDVEPGSFGYQRTPFNNVFQVLRFDQTAGAVTAGGTPTAGGQSVADPRLGCSPTGGTLRVVPWEGASPTVVGTYDLWSSGGFSVPDPRFSRDNGTHGTKFAVDHFDAPARIVTGGRVGSGGLMAADPRPASAYHKGVMGVAELDEPSVTVTGRGGPSNGRYSVADVRFGCAPRAGTMRVLDWSTPGETVTGGNIHNGPSAVGDPRWIQAVIEAAGFILISPWGTWNRPLTPLELAALQGFPAFDEDGSPLELAGTSTTRWRMAIGNAVPPPSAQAVAEAMLRTLQAADSGWEFMLDPGDVWVSPTRPEHDLVRAR